jgi:hypothetical protein
MDKIMLPYEFVKFFIKIEYYSNYYVVIWRNKFELSLEDTGIFIYIQDMSHNETFEPKNNFQTIFKIVLEAHIVQLRILFISAQNFIKTIENTGPVQKNAYYLYVAQIFYISLCPKDW